MSTCPGRRPVSGTGRPGTFFLFAVLQLVKFAVDAVFFDQFSVGALLDKFALVENENLVDMLDGAQAVSDYQARAILDQLLEPFLDEHFRFGVDIARGFVKDENRRVMRQSAGEAEELLLSHAEDVASFARDGFVSFRIFFDERRSVDKLCGPLDFFFVDVFRKTEPVATLGSADLPDLAGPIINILKEMTVNRPVMRIV